MLTTQNYTLRNSVWIRIFNHILEVGEFQPECIKGFYDKVNFTHEDWISLVKHLDKNLVLTNLDVDEFIDISIAKFENGKDTFIFRTLDMGSHADQLMTLEHYEKVFAALDDKTSPEYAEHQREMAKFKD